MHAADHAIQIHGAQAVYTAAYRHMAGDRRHGLISVGLHPVTMGDVWRVMSAAHAQLGPAAQVIEAAQVSAALERI